MARRMGLAAVFVGIYVACVSKTTGSGQPLMVMNEQTLLAMMVEDEAGATWFGPG